MNDYIAGVAQIAAGCQIVFLMGTVIAVQFASPSCPRETFADGVTTVFVVGWMASSIFLAGVCAFLLREKP